MKKFELEVAFNSNDYSEAPSIIELTITDKDEEQIRLAQSLIKQHGFDSIRLDFQADKFLDNEDGTESPWEAKVEKLIVYSDAVFYYAQSDGRDQIETSEIEL